jgi:outer membrane protein assembly factor BamB
MSPPAVVNGVIYFATDQYTWALNASDGSSVWKYPARSFISYPAVSHGMVYLGSGEGSKGTLLALNATTGQSIWNYTNYEYSRTFSPPAVANDIVYVGSYDGKIHAVDAYSGEKIWDYPAGDVHSGPAVANGIVYAMNAAGNIYALDAISGTKIWNRSLPTLYSGAGPGSPFAITNNVIYSRNYGKTLYAFNSASGDKIWDYTFETRPVSFPTLVKDTLYVSSDNLLFALNAKNGEIIWNYALNATVSSPVVVNSVAYVTSGGQLHAIAIPTPIEYLAPSISGLSITNRTYTLQNIPLTFNVNKNVSWLAYNLDNQGNVTIQGNTTITGLSDGPHSIVVYAIDENGHSGASETIYFTTKTFPDLSLLLVSAAAIIGAALIVVYIWKKK